MFVRGFSEIEEKRLVADDSASVCSKAIDETLRSYKRVAMVLVAVKRWLGFESARAGTSYKVVFCGKNIFQGFLAPLFTFRFWPSPSV